MEPVQIAWSRRAGVVDECDGRLSSNRGCAYSTCCEDDVEGFRQGPPEVNFWEDL